MSVAKMISMPGVVIQLNVALRVFTPTSKLSEEETVLSTLPTPGNRGEQARMKMNMSA